ncbi:anaphase-promoting complex subunit 5 [Striga asiatica]|uniref:Anaphase-promoting complex subunit 5 n=1 Tax=Striga asiatica TaxID=4170 RepID=A0A5A7PLR9_STRAF|nr:anaphase-promoting complex subunit 5 [Striga asiatica]
MTAIPKTPATFAVTPHKLSICVLVQVYAPPSQTLIPFPFSSVSQHNRLGIFIISLTKTCDGISEPTLDELIAQLREIGGLLNHWLSDHLTRRLSSLASPDDLFNLFADLRGILGGSDSNVMDDDQIMLDPNSSIGMFIRRCLLAFNQMSFELELVIFQLHGTLWCVCHLLTSIGTYCKESLSGYPPHGLSHLDDSVNDPNSSCESENMEMDNYVYEKVSEDFEETRIGIERTPFRGQAPGVFSELVKGTGASSSGWAQHADTNAAVSFSALSSSDRSRDIDSISGTFLHTNWQVQGYLSEQADDIEKNGNSFPLNAFESILKKLQQLAPELHRVHYLRYLNNLYHDDYPGALENLHRYFDYSAGTEGVECVSPPSGCSSFGRYEVALLCLGMMHFHLGHPKQALEVLSEAVRVSQQYSDDTCLSYTLVAIANLLSEIGISETRGIMGSSYWPVADIGTSLSVQQQLYVLLRRSLKRAESLKLKRLVASIHLEIAKYDITDGSYGGTTVEFWPVGIFPHPPFAMITLRHGYDAVRMIGIHVRKYVVVLAYICFRRKTHVQRPLVSFGPKTSMKLRTYPANVYKELWLSSHLINEFSEETSVMTADGAFCTAWLKSLRKPSGSLVLIQANETRSHTDAFQFSAQPNSIPGSVLQLVGSSYLIRAGSWETYGSAPLARINALVFATCFSDSSSVSDAALAYSKLIQHLAVYKGYKDAFAALKIAEEKFTCVSESRILVVKLQLLHECALHRGHLKLAQNFCDELGVLASPVTGVDMELKAEASLRHARTLLAAKQYSQAAAVANSLFSMCYKFNMQVKNATVLLLLAEIHMKSGNAVLGIPYALASLSFCQSFNLDLLKASATLILAQLWLSLGSNHAIKALSLLHSSFPMLLGHGGLELRARAFITEAKCYLADPSFSVSENSDMVLEPLQQASEELQLLEYHELASEAFYLMAIVYDMLGQLDDREAAASSFRKHITALENPQDMDYSLYCLS